MTYGQMERLVELGYRVFATNHKASWWLETAGYVWQSKGCLPNRPKFNLSSLIEPTSKTLQYTYATNK